MKIHVKPNRTNIVVIIAAFVLLLIMAIWGTSIERQNKDIIAIFLFFFLLECVLFINLCCALRSYTLDTDGIYVEWHVVNKTHFHPWSSFKDNYCMRSNIIGEYLETVVFSKKKRRFRVRPRRVVIDGAYPFSTVGIVICDDTCYTEKKHSHCVCKSQFVELMQYCSIPVEWNAKPFPQNHQKLH